MPHKYSIYGAIAGLLLARALARGTFGPEMVGYWNKVVS